MAAYMGDNQGCGFTRRVFQHWRRSSVHSLSSSNEEKTTIENELTYGAAKKGQSTPVEGTRARPESEKQISKLTLASPRLSISKSQNQGRRLSDGARSSTTTTSSSSNSSGGKKENLLLERWSSGDQGGSLRASSGNILQLAQMASLKQLAYASPAERYLPGIASTKSLEKNLSMGNILRRNSEEIKLQGPMNKLDFEELKSTALGWILEGVSECREAVRIDPPNQHAHHSLATLYFKLGHAEEALEHFNHSEGITNVQDITQAKALQACFSKCTEAEELNDWVTVLRQTHDAISIGANSSLQIYALQAQALLNLHKHEEADITLKTRPNFDMDFYSHLFGKARSCYLYLIEAKVYMATGRFEEAIRAAQTAARLNPSGKGVKEIVITTRYVAMARSKGNELFQELKFLEACRTYNEGLEYDSYNSILLCNRAACRTKLGQFEKAMEDCNLALILRPSYSKARLRRAHCNTKLERWEASIRDYEMLISEKPGDNEVGQALFEAQIELKKERGEDVKDMKFGSKVVSVPNVECFRHLITSPGMSVVLFRNKSSQEKTLALLDQVCQKFPSINFLKVEVEDHPYLAKSEEVINIPAFKIYKNGSRVIEIPGHNQQLLEDSVKLHSS